MTIQEQYENLEKTVRGYNPTADFQHIRAAFEFAAEAHKDQKRKSGEPYIIHPLAVAQIVAEELRLDSESIEAALLHDVIEDTAICHRRPRRPPTNRYPNSFHPPSPTWWKASAS